MSEEQTTEETAREAAARESEQVRVRRGKLGELRGYLTVVPESRWIKHAAHQEYFFGELTEHYEEHAKELAAILAAAGR